MNAPERSPGAPGKVLQLLHIEDSPDDATLVQLTLGPGYALTRVETEEEYLRCLDEGAPDAILCDYHLPRFSAERALEILGARGLDIPFIVVSHHIGESAPVIAMQQGASDYLSKGDMRRLQKAIDSAIERAAARREKARALQALRASEAMKRSILDSLESPIALLDADGRILAVNRAWEQFGPEAQPWGPGRACAGGNYLEALRARAGRGEVAAGEAAAAIARVIARELAVHSAERRVTAGALTRWYLERAVPLAGAERGAVLTYVDITDRMLAHVALQEAHGRMQALSKQVLAVQEEERRGISRELHDDIGQSLAALKIGLHRTLAAGAAQRPGLEAQCAEILEGTIERLRRISQDLRPPQLDQLGLQEALEWLVERQRAMTGVAIEARFSGTAGRRLPAVVETACYRIAQEAMNNATRHAKAKSVSLRVECEGRLAKLTVGDDGVGFDAAAARDRAVRNGSVGLVSMEERARLAGGQFSLRTVPGAGTTVRVIFALAPEPAAAASRGAAARA